jgi:hypothetical protein
VTHESEFALVQALYSEGAQQLTDAEMQAANFEPVSPYIFTLQRQEDMLQVSLGMHPSPLSSSSLGIHTFLIDSCR